MKEQISNPKVCWMLSPASVFNKAVQEHKKARENW